MAKQNTPASPYAQALAAWPVKVLGPKPTVENFDTAHKLGCAPGKQAFARALELRPCGATDGQIKMACSLQWGNSGSHNNKRKALIEAGLVTRDINMPKSAHNHTVYRIELTTKGKAMVAGTPVAEKPKPVAKATTAKAAKPAKPVKAKRNTMLAELTADKVTEAVAAGENITDAVAEAVDDVIDNVTVGRDY